MALRVLAASLAVAQATCRPPWSYRDLDWSKLGMCGHRSDQAPIDIDTSKVSRDAPLGPLVITPGKWAAPGTAQLNEHTWQVNLKAAEAGITWEGEFYDLTQFHFHSPSENTVNGRHYDMEMHLVHANQHGRILVVAYFFEVGKTANSYLGSFWNHFPAQDGLEKETFIPAPYRRSDLYSWPQPTGSYYAFEGSLTTPPCTNDTQWIVMTEPAGMSHEQLQQYREGIDKPACTQLADIKAVPAGVSKPFDLRLGVNNRPTQPMGSRVVYEFAGASHPFAEFAETPALSMPAICGLAALSVALPTAAVAAMVKRSRPAADNYLAIA